MKPLPLGVRGAADNTTIRLDEMNEPQPDALLLIDSGLRWSSTCQAADDYVETAPELVAEISKRASASYDLHTKLEAYLDETA